LDVIIMDLRAQLKHVVDLVQVTEARELTHLILLSKRRMKTPDTA
jgi:hypothetical protein